MQVFLLFKFFFGCEAPSGLRRVSNRWCLGTGLGITDTMVPVPGDHLRVEYVDVEVSHERLALWPYVLCSAMRNIEVRLLRYALYRMARYRSAECLCRSKDDHDTHAECCRRIFYVPNDEEFLLAIADSLWCSPCSYVQLPFQVGFAARNKVMTLRALHFFCRFYRKHVGLCDNVVDGSCRINGAGAVVSMPSKPLCVFMMLGEVLMVFPQRYFGLSIFTNLVQV